jgi:hypothetical protein
MLYLYAFFSHICLVVWLQLHSLWNLYSLCSIILDVTVVQNWSTLICGSYVFAFVIIVLNSWITLIIFVCICRFVIVCMCPNSLEKLFLACPLVPLLTLTLCLWCRCSIWCKAQGTTMCRMTCSAWTTAKNLLEAVVPDGRQSFPKETIWLWFLTVKTYVLYELCRSWDMTLCMDMGLLYSGILTTMLLVEVVVKTWQFCSCMPSWHLPVHFIFS